VTRGARGRNGIRGFGVFLSPPAKGEGSSFTFTSALPRDLGQFSYSIPSSRNASALAFSVFLHSRVTTPHYPILVGSARIRPRRGRDGGWVRLRVPAIARCCRPSARCLPLGCADPALAPTAIPISPMGTVGGGGGGDGDRVRSGSDGVGSLSYSLFDPAHPGDRHLDPGLSSGEWSAECLPPRSVHVIDPG